MPTPPIAYKTVTGTYVGPDGTPVAGVSLRFIPSTTVTDSVGNVVVPPLPIFATTDGAGAFSVNLEVTDAPTSSPTGWFWRLSELFPPNREVEFQVPSSAASTVPLALLTSATFSEPQYSYMTTAQGAALDARMVAAEALAAIGGLDPLYLDPWMRPGANIDPSLQGGGVVDCPVGTTTVVAKPTGTGRRIIKTILVSAPTAGATVTLKLNGVTVFTRTFTTAGFHPPIDCTWPLSLADTNGLQAVVTGAGAKVTPTYGDRPDAVVDRFALTSSAAAGPTDLFASGTARTVSHLWVANLSASATVLTQVRIGSSVILPLTLTPGSYYSHESSIPVLSSQALRFAGDGTNALTYVVAGR